MRIVCILLAFLCFNLNASDSCFREIHFEEIDSTQDYAKKHGRELLASPFERVLISADKQLCGQGCGKNKWVSSCPENLYVTYIMLFPKQKESLIDQTMQVSALAILRTLQELGLNPSIKWINDVYVNEKKISGVLCETIPSSWDDYIILLIGVGLNVNMTEQECRAVNDTTTSIMVEKDERLDKAIVLSLLSEKLHSHIQILLEEGFSPLRNYIQEALLYKGADVLAHTEEGDLFGKIIGIDEDGLLLISLEDGDFYALAERTFEILSPEGS